MKLHIVPASRGIQWVKLGVQTFFKQPLALSGLFFLFVAMMSVLGMVPWVGAALMLVLLPGATLGLMAATREAAGGKFPMPWVLLTAFRAGRLQLRAMLTLGVLYTLGLALLLGCTMLIDGGKFAKLYVFGGPATAEMLKQGDMQLAALVAAVLSLPLTQMFWHAPALLYWHGVPPVKSLFFSLVACMRNFWAFTVFGLAWIGIFVLFVVLMAILVQIFGNPDAIAAALYPAVMLMAAMVTTSIYFTFQDSFEFTPGDDI
jgi:hypothetical protein